MSNGKLMIDPLIGGLIKQTQSNKCLKTSQYIPKPYESFGGDINVRY